MSEVAPVSDDALWTAAELVAATRGHHAGGPIGPATGVSIDSRSLAAGDAFVALNGPNSDGHDFVSQALGKGASAAVVAKAADVGEAAPLIVVEDTQTALEFMGDAARRRTHAKIAAVTGSVGKTGTKEMLALALGEQGPTHRSAASYNNQWGVPLSLARMPRDVAFAVFEVGMNHPGEIAPLARQIRPDVAVVTTVEPAHLEFFPSVEAIADAKAEIFLGLSGDGTAVLNRDNPHFDRLDRAARDRGVQNVVSFGVDDAADVRLGAIVLDADGSNIEAELDGTVIAYRLGQPGRHLAMNSLAVLAAARALGADPLRAAESLIRFAGVKGRGQRSPIKVRNGTAYLIDESYNANPASVRAALAVLGHVVPGPQGRRIAVLGDMRELGDTAATLHADLADAVEAASVDLLFTCGPLMRELHEAVPSDRRGGWAASAAELLATLATELRAGDVVLVKGSLGSRMADIVGPLVAAAEPAPHGDR